MCLPIPPNYPMTSVISFLKGNSATAVARLRGREQNFTGEHLWARGCAVWTGRIRTGADPVWVSLNSWPLGSVPIALRHDHASLSRCFTLLRFGNVPQMQFLNIDRQLFLSHPRPNLLHGLR